MHRSAIRAGAAFVCGLAAAWLLATAPPSAQTPQPPAARQRIFRAGVDIVTVDAYPRRNGRIVEGLTRDDFEVLEDGKPQAVEQFDFVRIEPTPDDERDDPASTGAGFGQVTDPYRRVFAIFLDLFHINVLGSQTVRTPVVELIDGVLGANDLVGFLTPRLPAATLRFTRKRQTIEDEFMKYWQFAESDKIDSYRDPSEKEIERCFDNSISQPLIRRHRMALTLQALADLTDFMSQLRSARMYVLVVADNWILYREDPALQSAIEHGQSMLEPRTGRGGAGTLDRLRPTENGCNQLAKQWLGVDVQGQWMTLLQRAQQRNVVFYTISPRGVAASTVENDALISLAHSTDGESIMSLGQYRRAIDHMAADTSAYYLLGYRSTNPPVNGQSRQIKVRVKQSGVSVVARRAYTAPTAKEAALMSAMNRAEVEAPTEVRSALARLDEGDASTALATYGVEWRSGESLVVVAELSEREAAQARWAGGATLDVDVTGNGGEPVGHGTARIEPGARGGMVRLPVTAALRAWRLTVRVTAGADVLAARSVVVESGGGLVGDAVIYRGGTTAQSLLRPAATPVFSRLERVRVEWAVRSTLDKRQARLLDRLGQPLPIPVTVTERTTDGDVVDADLSLAALAPGDYVIHLSVVSGTTTEERYVSLRVK